MYDQYKNMLIRKFLLEVNYLPTYTVLVFSGNINCPQKFPIMYTLHIFCYSRRQHRN